MTYHYRKWAPKELCEYHKDWVKNYPDPNNEALQILEKLITNKQMESIWKKLDKLAEQKNTQNYYFDLLLAIQPDGPFGIDRLTKGELRDAVKEIEKKSRELTFLVKRIMPYAFINNAPKTLDNLVINVLKDIGNQARDVLSEPRTINKPGSENPKKDYFVRQLSAFFRQTFGKPLHKVVADLHSIMMPDDEGITEVNVWNIVKNSPL